MINLFILQLAINSLLCASNTSQTLHIVEGNSRENSNESLNVIRNSSGCAESCFKDPEYSLSDENETLLSDGVYFLPIYSSNNNNQNNEDCYTKRRWSIRRFIKEYFNCCFSSDNVPEFSYTSYKDDDDFEDPFFAALSTSTQLICNEPTCSGETSFKNGNCDTEQSNKDISTEDDVWDSDLTKEISYFNTLEFKFDKSDNIVNKARLQKETRQKHYRCLQRKCKKRHRDFHARKRLPTIKENVVHAL